MGEGAALQIGAVHIYGGNLRVAVGGVVVDAAGGIAAGGINSDLILAGGHLTAAAHLLHAAKDVEELTEKVLHEARVFITPGFIFGSNGARYIRISLCCKDNKLAEALERIKRIKNK